MQRSRLSSFRVRGGFAAVLLVAAPFVLTLPTTARAQAYQIRGIAPLAGDGFSTAHGVNSQGDVVGSSAAFGSDGFATSARAFLYSAVTGQVTELPPLGTPVFSEAVAVNDDSLVAGYSSAINGSPRPVA